MDDNHFTPFGARVCPPPQISLTGPSPLARHIARRINALILLVAALSLCAAACVVTAAFVALDRQIAALEKGVKP